MELQAALFVLEKLKKIKFDPLLTIKTDSKYLIDGMEKWMSNWKKKGWKTASGKKVLNQDLWKALDHPELPKSNFNMSRDIAEKRIMIELMQLL